MEVSENPEIRMLQGDCLDLMSEIDDNTVDMILCDLPYGMTECDWDSVIPLAPLWNEYERIVKDAAAIVLTASQPFTSRLVMSNPSLFRYSLIWEKDKASNFLLAKKRIQKYHEDILIFYKDQCTFNPIKWDAGRKPNKGGQSGKLKDGGYITADIAQKEHNSSMRYPKSILQFNTPKANDGRNRCIHPTQKPVSLFRYLIKTYSNSGDLVLDNCMGSGTTPIACFEENRRCVGIEKHTNNYESAVQRFQEHTKQGQLFSPEEQYQKPK